MQRKTRASRQMEQFGCSARAGSSKPTSFWPGWPRGVSVRSLLRSTLNILRPLSTRGYHRHHSIYTFMHSPQLPYLHRNWFLSLQHRLDSCEAQAFRKSFVFHARPRYFAPSSREVLRHLRKSSEPTSN